MLDVSASRFFSRTVTFAPVLVVKVWVLAFVFGWGAPPKKLDSGWWNIPIGSCFVPMMKGSLVNMLFTLWVMMFADPWVCMSLPFAGW